MQEIKTINFGCRLNQLESDKIRAMITPYFDHAIIINTCGVTNNAHRECVRAARRTHLENPKTPIFITGCASQITPTDFNAIPNVKIIPNADKLKLSSYINIPSPKTDLSRAYIQIQNGCNHACTYCITRIARGQAVSFPYNDILSDAKAAAADGFSDFVLTGIDIASWQVDDLRISDLCEKLLSDVPQIKILRLSSMDPACPDLPRVIDLIHRNPAMANHLHLSVQSCNDFILKRMARRHRKCDLKPLDGITTSWDIICGFPGETDEMFLDTINMARELKPIRIHAFPFSPRPGTIAAEFKDRVDNKTSKQRVKILGEIASQNLDEFKKSLIGKTIIVSGERGNIAKTMSDISIKTEISDKEIKTITVH